MQPLQADGPRRTLNLVRLTGHPLAILDLQPGIQLVQILRHHLFKQLDGTDQHLFADHVGVIGQKAHIQHLDRLLGGGHRQLSTLGSGK